MPIELCKKCGRLHYVPGECHVSLRSVILDGDVHAASAKKMGRPKTIADMKVYKADKERLRRLLPICPVCGGKHKVGNPCRSKLRDRGEAIT